MAGANGRRLWLRLASGLLVGLGVTALAFYALGKVRLSRAIASARQAGMPLEWSEVEAPPIESRANAATSYLAIASELQSGASSSDALRSLRNMNASEISPWKLSEVETDLGRIASVVKRAERAAEMPGCRFARVKGGPMMSNLAEFDAMTTSVRLLLIKARVQSFHGDEQEARRTLFRAAKTVHHLGAEPALGGFFGLVMGERLFQRTLEQWIGDHQRDPIVLADAQALEAEFVELPSVRRYLGQEIAKLRDTWHGLTLGELMMESGGNGPPSFAEWVTLKVGPMRDVCEARMIEKLTGLWRNLPLDGGRWEEAGSSLKAYMASVEADRSFGTEIDKIVLPQVSTDLVGSVIANRRIVRTAIWLLETRNRLGSLPRSLPASEDSTDPFDHNPLRYRREDGGFFVYSIGPDRKDDGGV